MRRMFWLRMQDQRYWEEYKDKAKDKDRDRDKDKNEKIDSRKQTPDSRSKI